MSRRRRWGWIAAATATALLALGAAACGSADLPRSVTTTTTPPTTTVEDLEAALDPTCVAGADVAPGATVEAVEVDGVTRTYLRYVPSSYEGVAMPVVVSLHNTGATAAQQDEASGLRTSADAHGFVLVTPQGLGDPPTWDAGEASTDVAFVEAVLDQAGRTFCLDPDRVFAVGSGDGSVMAARLACDAADRIAAAGFVGVVPDPDPCEQARPVPVVVLPGFDADLGPWAQRYGCDPEPDLVPYDSGTPGDIQGDYQGCDEGAALRSLTVAGQADGNDGFWDFFVAHPLVGTD